MTTFKDLALEVSKLLNDSYRDSGEYDFTRWSEDDLKEYAIDAIRILVIELPEKFAKITQADLVAGRIQQTDCDTILKVIGVHGQNDTPASLTSSVVDDRIDALFSKQMCVDSDHLNKYVLKSYTLEENMTNVFYVNPPVPGSVLPLSVDIICSDIPDNINDDDYNIATWAHNAIIEWMLYRAYSNEDESQYSQENAKMHLNHFYAILKMIKESIESKKNGKPNATVATDQAS